MKEINGLRNLRESSSSCIYCPKCHNTLQVVNNGFFHGELFYCQKEHKVFAIYLKDITEKAGENYLNQCKDDIEVQITRDLILRNNYKQVSKFLGKDK